MLTGRRYLSSLSFDRVSSTSHVDTSLLLRQPPVCLAGLKGDRNSSFVPHRGSYPESCLKARLRKNTSIARLRAPRRHSSGQICKAGASGKGVDLQLPEATGTGDGSRRGIPPDAQRALTKLFKSSKAAASCNASAQLLRSQCKLQVRPNSRLCRLTSFAFGSVTPAVLNQ